MYRNNRIVCNTKNLNKIKLSKTNQIEVVCGYCGEKILCSGSKWSVVKKVFIKKVNHHRWLHEKDFQRDKVQPQRQFVFSESMSEYSDEYKEDLLYLLREANKFDNPKALRGASAFLYQLFGKVQEMTNAFFIKIIVLMLLAGFILYWITPKYTFNAYGDIRKNRFTGDVQMISDNGQWISTQKKDDGFGFVPDESKP